jgi:hypothetical protein
VDVNKVSQRSKLAAGIDRERFVFDEAIEKDRGVSSTPSLPLSKLDSALAADISAVSQIDAVASILEVICRTTGMGFAAVARLTRDRWVACAVRDEIAFGLLPGGELDVRTTIATKFAIAAGRSSSTMWRRTINSAATIRRQCMVYRAIFPCRSFSRTAYSLERFARSTPGLRS